MRQRLAKIAAEGGKATGKAALCVGADILTKLVLFPVRRHLSLAAARRGNVRRFRWNHAVEADRGLRGGGEVLADT